MFLWGTDPSTQGRGPLVQLCTFNSHGVRLLLCSCLTKASCLTVHTVTGKILRRKPPTLLFTFCSAIGSEVKRRISCKVLICWDRINVGLHTRYGTSKSLKNGLHKIIHEFTVSFIEFTFWASFPVSVHMSHIPKFGGNHSY